MVKKEKPVRETTGQSGVDESSVNCLAQVRSILFGEEAARIDHEREAMRNEVDGALEELRQEIQSNFRDQSNELHKSIADLSSAIEAETAQRIERMSDDKEEVLGRLERAKAQLADAKVDRRAMAALFQELAQQLLSDTAE
jgi:gas vesicle protein